MKNLIDLETKIENEDTEETLELASEDVASVQTSDNSIMQKNSDLAEIAEKLSANKKRRKRKDRKNGRVVGEIKSLKRANSKSFELSNGIRRTEYYPTSLYCFNDETQEFEDTDLTIYEDSDGEHFKSGKHNFTAKFNRNTDDEELFTLQKGMHKVTVKAKRSKKNSEKKMEAKLTNRRKDVFEKAKKSGKDFSGDAEALNSVDKVTFTNYAKDTDIEYSLCRKGVKENIVIHKKRPSYKYTFLMDFENVIPEYVENQSRIVFKSEETGKEVFNIPAPYMVDAAGAVSHDVTMEMKPVKKSPKADRKATDENGMQIMLVADSEWINAVDRVFPVKIDPQVNTSSDSNICLCQNCSNTTNNGETYIISTSSCCSAQNNSETSNCACQGNLTVEIKKDESISENDAVKKYLKITRKCTCSNDELTLLLSVKTSACTCVDLTPFKKTCDACNIIYWFDITSYYGTYSSYELKVVKSAAQNVNCGTTQNTSSGNTNTTSNTTSDTASSGGSNATTTTTTTSSSCCCCNSVEIFGEESAYAPSLVVEENVSFAVNFADSAIMQDFGRYGVVGVDAFRGNQIISIEDFAWNGNRMPVTIQHLYNGIFADYQYTQNEDLLLMTADFSKMKIGNGWKLNLMQSMIAADNGEGETVYIYTGANGGQIVLEECSKGVATAEPTGSSASSATATPEAGPAPTPAPTPSDPDAEVEKEGVVNSDYSIIKDNGSCGKYSYGEKCEIVYDSSTRIMTVKEETKYFFDLAGRLVKVSDKHGNEMEITYKNGRITSVTDGADRTFVFSYSGDYLRTITAPDDSVVRYGYYNSQLTSVTYPDGRKIVFTNENSNPVILLKDADDKEIYAVEYEYFKDFAKDIREYGVRDGVRSLAKTTEFVVHSIENWREVVSTEVDNETGEKDTVRTVYKFDDSGNLVSCYLKTSDDPDYIPVTNERSVNRLVNHSFERDIDTDEGGWSSIKCDSSVIKTVDNNAYIGSRALYLCNCECTDENGVVQTEYLWKKGKHTFSAYVYVPTDFDNTYGAGVFLRVTDKDGNVIAESEKVRNSTPGYTRIWVPFDAGEINGIKLSIVIKGKGSVYVDAAQLEDNPTANAYNMIENGSFTSALSCWSHSLTGGNVDPGNGLEINEYPSLYYNGAHYSDNLDDYPHQSIPVKEIASNRGTYVLSGWGYCFGENSEASGENLDDTTFFIAAKIHYKNAGIEPDSFAFCFSREATGWQFNSVTLRKTKLAEIERISVYCCFIGNYEKSHVCFGNLQLVRKGMETGLTEADFSDDTDSEENEFEEYFDDYGNQITETTFEDDSTVTLYRSFGYSEDGNDLVRITDERGAHTLITVDEETSNVLCVTDRCGNISEYEYDEAGRVEKLIGKTNGGHTTAELSYDYDEYDNIVGITRSDGMKYEFAYSEFRTPISVSIAGVEKPIAEYAYKNNSGRLKKISYADGETVDVVYNNLGQIVSETVKNSSGDVIARRKYDYDLQGNVARTVDLHNRKEYTYTYSESNLVRVAENDIHIDDVGNITARFFCNAVNYEYDDKGRVKRSRYNSLFAPVQEYRYTWQEKTGVKQSFVTKGKIYQSEIHTDALGRIVSDNICLGTGNIQRDFTYLAGAKTAEHVEHGKCKSNATTNLVSKISFTDSRTISYEYDGEENISKVVDSSAGTTEYTYDSLGQLLTETVDGVTVNSMTYDAFGNILRKNGVVYEYDSVWKDRLVKVGADTITYDASGCPTNYRGYAATWQNGRMMSFGTNTYTYNCNGIRTSKTVNGIKHTYTLEGSRIVCEKWADHELVPMYDATGNVYGIVYDDAPYFFMRNLQGDILSIMDKDGNAVAEYAYDAWGKCTIVSDTSGCDIANVNPFRYRGYYYDAETGLYWLSTRYYSPELCRFISPDDVSYLDPTSINGLNLYAYCMNDPVNYADPSGHWVETVFDLFSLGVSIVEVIINPYDPLNWTGLAGDALDLIPFVTGVGETVRGVKVVAKGVDIADDAYDTIRIMKAVDFTDDAWDTVRGLDRAGDFTQSTMSVGRKIHKGYKFDLPGKEFGKIPGIRIDYFDEVGKRVYELKPYNVKSLKAGVSQLSRYRRTMGKGYTWILELY